MMKKIVWFCQSNLPNQLVTMVQDYLPGHDYRQYQTILSLCYTHSFWPRSTSAPTPFRTDPGFFPTAFTHFGPNLDNFEHITDQRCHWLKANKWDRPWLVDWSGGFDTTLMVCAILKNISESDLDNITIGLTNTSIWENPIFYHTQIKNRFRTVDISRCEPNELGLHYHITGEPADMLAGSGLAENAANSGIDLRLPWRSNQSQLIEFLSTKSIGPIGARWLVENMARDLDNRGHDSPEVNNLIEWFWHINFDWKWITKILPKFSPEQNNAQTYLGSLINWFESREYQQWSIETGRYSLLSSSTGSRSYKPDWREYIYKFWRDDYHYNFKTKVASTSLSQTLPKTWACLLDDYSCLRADRDMEQILQLFPHVINNK